MPCVIANMHSARAILSFFMITFGWSWVIYFAAYQAKPSSQALNIGLSIAAGFGPSLAGFVVVALFSEGAGLRDWLARCLNWRIAWGWWALVFLAPPILMACALALNGALGGTMPVLPALEKIPLVIVNFGLVALIGGPLGEEFGWRGYAMPALSAKLGWRGASLVIGLLWGFWHIQLFFIAGTAQSQMPIAVFMLNIMGSVEDTCKKLS
jgi:membrane protease YdiL (CAAX protease family)